MITVSRLESVDVVSTFEIPSSDWSRSPLVEFWLTAQPASANPRSDRCKMGRHRLVYRAEQSIDLP